MEKILYVEDDLSLIDGLKYTLEKSGYLVDNARTVKEALFFYRQNKYDLLLLDVTLPDGSGFDICKEVLQTCYNNPILPVGGNNSNRKSGEEHGRQKEGSAV